MELGFLIWLEQCHKWLQAFENFVGMTIEKSLTKYFLYLYKNVKRFFKILFDVLLTLQLKIPFQHAKHCGIEINVNKHHSSILLEHPILIHTNYYHIPHYLFIFYLVSIWTSSYLFTLVFILLISYY